MIYLRSSFGWCILVVSQLCYCQSDNIKWSSLTFLWCVCRYRDWNGINRLWRVFPLLWNDPILWQSTPGYWKCKWTELWVYSAFCEKTMFLYYFIFFALRSCLLLDLPSSLASKGLSASSSRSTKWKPPVSSLAAFLWCWLAGQLLESCWRSTVSFCCSGEQRTKKMSHSSSGNRIRYLSMKDFNRDLLCLRSLVQGLLPSHRRLHQKNTCPGLHPKPVVHQCSEYQSASPRCGHPAEQRRWNTSTAWLFYLFIVHYRDAWNHS